ncbi:uncharacterized protein LOC118431937 isoform X2 [Branchiostoma floridae]|uniref:Uncharacterized protein LOC118431937 isoform X2 n=1 Tax=Branchiostoma floridae TaxID=7739 RepID=A0A9J7ME65_BRAFL|nr:uncharacterized protein LOC118431937 isoform X2 [Branchiostoma floridae]
MYAFRSTGRMFMFSRGGPTLASLVHKVRFCQASALNGAALQLVEAHVDWASQLTAHPARIRGRKWLPGSHSPKFPEFLAQPKDGYVHVFTPVEKVDCSPEECAPAMRQVIRDVLERRKEGALLFRGLPLVTAEDFSRALVKLGLKLINYEGGSGIRQRLAEAVDTASDEPPEFCIEPHNEMAYTPHFPEKVMFFCLDPPSPGAGGETVIADVREILPRLDKDVVDKFEKLGVMYWHHLPSHTPGAYNSWQKLFQTEDRAAVEKHLIANNTSWKWEDDNLSWWITMPPMLTYRGEKLWFCSVHVNNASYFSAHPLWFNKDIPDHHFPFHTYYGDGTDIEAEVLQHIRDVHWQIIFFCLDPPSPGAGGETVISDVREVLSRLDKDVVDKFEKLGVMYWKHLPSHTPGAYFSWQTSFQTEDRAVVEKQMIALANNTNWRWEDGNLSMWNILYPMYKYRGEKLWLCVAHGGHASYLKAHPLWFDKDIPDHHFPFTTYYGDGTDIETEVLQHIRDVHWQVSMGFQMQKGDLLVLNNIYCQHARLSYTGKRKLAVALAKQDQVG